MSERERWEWKPKKGSRGEYIEELVVAGLVVMDRVFVDGVKECEQIFRPSVLDRAPVAVIG